MNELTRKDMDIITTALQQAIKNVRIDWIKEDIKKTLSNFENYKKEKIT